MFEDYDRGDRLQKAGMFRARLIIFGFIIVVGLIAAGVMKWSKHSLHEKLAKHHEQTTATIISAYPNGQAPNIIYGITYTFTVNGKKYQNTGESRVMPNNPQGVVWYDPDDPEQNELQAVLPAEGRQQ